MTLCSLQIRCPVSLFPYHKPILFPYSLISLLYPQWAHQLSGPCQCIGVKNRSRPSTHQTVLATTSSECSAPSHPQTRLPVIEPIAPPPSVLHQPNPTLPLTTAKILYMPDSELDAWSAAQTPPFRGPVLGHLDIHIGKKECFSWDLTKRRADKFLETPHDLSLFGNMSLDVKWPLDREVDQDGFFGRNVVKTLFLYLNTKSFRAWPRRISIAAFRRISISVPTEVKNLVPPDTPSFLATGYNNIQLQEAVHLKEFYWRGHFLFLATKFKGIPFHCLSVLDISECSISTQNALLLLRLSPNLAVVALQTIEQVNKCDSDAWSSSQSQPLEFPQIGLRQLQEMRIASNTSLIPLFKKIRVEPTLNVISLVVNREATQTLHGALQALGCAPSIKTFQVHVTGDPDFSQVALLVEAFPSISVKF